MLALKFHDLVKYRTAIMMFKAYSGKLPTLLQNRFNRSLNVHHTCRMNTFIVTYSRTNMKAMCLSVVGVKLWNMLPENIKDTRSVYIFKKLVSKVSKYIFIQAHQRAHRKNKTKKQANIHNTNWEKHTAKSAQRSH